MSYDVGSSNDFLIFMIILIQDPKNLNKLKGGICDILKDVGTKGKNRN